MLLVYLILWFIFNEHITLELLIIGLLMCAVADLFSLKIICRKHPRLKTLPLLLWEGIRYFGFLIREIFIANYAVMKLIVSPSTEVEPQLHTFCTALETNAARVALANSITMTPGTITVDMHDDLFLIHCLDTSFDVGKEGLEMERRVMAVEGTPKAKKSKKGAKKA